MPFSKSRGPAAGLTKRAASALKAVNRALDAALRFVGIVLLPVVWVLRAAPKVVDTAFAPFGWALRAIGRASSIVTRAADAPSRAAGRALQPVFSGIRPYVRPAVYVGGAITIVMMVSPWRDRSDARASGADAGLLLPTEVAAKDRRASVFPVDAGRRWSMLVSAGDSRFMLDTVVLGRRSFGAREAYLFETRQGGRPVQQKAYLVTDRGVDRVAIGARGQTVIEPPMPLIRYPVRVGEALTWRGRLVSSAGITKADGLCKVSCVDRIDTPAGEMTAYLLRMLITGRSGKGAMRYASRVWLAPRTGIVREEFPYNGLTATSELLRSGRG